MQTYHLGFLPAQKAETRFGSYSLSALLLSLMLPALAFAQQESPIRLGAVLPLSGNASFFGNAARIGIRAALQKINGEEGGVLGRKLEVVFEDMRSEPNLTVPAYKRLVEKHDPAVILTVLRNSALLLEPLATEDQRLLFVESSRPDLLKKNGFMLRSFFTTDKSNEVLVSRLKSKFLNVAEMEDRNLKLGVLAIDEDWSRPVIEDLERRISGSRIQLLEKQFFSKTNTDLKKQLTSFKKQNLDALLVLALGKTATPIYQQLAATPIATEVYGFAVCNDDDLFASAKQHLQGVYSLGPKLDRKGPLYERLQKISNQERPGEPVDMTSISSMNAVLIIAEALRNKAFTSEEIRAFILAQKHFDTIVGKVTFDQNGDAKWKAQIDRVQDNSCQVVN